MSKVQYKNANNVIGSISNKVSVFIKRCKMHLENILVPVLTFIAGGGLLKIITLRSERKKSEAEALGEEMTNHDKVVARWEKLTDELQEQLTQARKNAKEQGEIKDKQIEALQKKLDERWTDTLVLRDKIQNQMEELSKLKVQMAAMLPKICNVKGCEKRDPPTGY